MTSKKLYHSSFPDNRKLGNGINVIALGVIMPCDFISDETAREIIKQKLGARKPEFLESNMKAYDLGREIGLSKNKI